MQIICINPKLIIRQIALHLGMPQIKSLQTAVSASKWGNGCFKSIKIMFMTSMKFYRRKFLKIISNDEAIFTTNSTNLS